MKSLHGPSLRRRRTGRPLPSHTTWGLLVRPPFGTANQVRVGAPLTRLEAVRWALTQVASITSTSSGAAPASASVSAERANSERITWTMPFSHQRRQRLVRVL